MSIGVSLQDPSGSDAMAELRDELQRAATAPQGSGTCENDE